MSAAAPKKVRLYKRLYRFTRDLSVRGAVYSKQKSPIIWKYMKVEFAPPKLRELKQLGPEIKQVANIVFKGGWQEKTFYQYWIQAFCAFDILLWFFLGEIIGKRYIIGYPVFDHCHGWGHEEGFELPRHDLIET